ncbi:MAG: TrmB family transcriptional regulator sugar-binding domain-containing protein, partial [Candidatus Thorarchaeota archaeon]
FLKNLKLLSSSEGKPKIYFRTNPKVALTEILKKKYQDIIEKLDKLEEYIQVNESDIGICTRNITFYHHSDINTGLEYIYELMKKAEKEILLSSLPPSLLKKLKGSLKTAYLRGIKIKIFYSKLDFEEIDNYFGQITDNLKDIKLEVIEISEKACRYVRFNDLIVNEGVILIDHYFNSILF